MTAPSTSDGWRPTGALLRAVALAATLLLAGVLLRRPDLVVVGAPFALGPVVALARRPRTVPTVALSVPPEVLLEGEPVVATVTLTTVDGVDAAAVALPLPVGLEPDDGPTERVVQLGDGGVRAVRFGLRSSRWGRRYLGPVRVVATASGGLLRAGPVTSTAALVTTWPLAEGFVATDAVPRAVGLVGPHRSRRPGEGSDVAGVRAFVPGDRLRRINWRVTGRTRELHVTATYSDRDTEVLLCLDSRQDLGEPPESSLDTGVRAAAAIAEHYLRAGDRVGLVDLGQGFRPVPARNGRRHLVRIVDLLLDVKPSTSRDTSGRVAGLLSARDLPALAAADALVVLLTPLATEGAADVLAGLALAGRSVLAIDTLPGSMRPPGRGDWSGLAYRVWRLRREARIGRLGELGVPVVPWRGAGSLDVVLRDVSVAARAPRGPRVTR